MESDIPDLEDFSEIIHFSKQPNLSVVEKLKCQTELKPKFNSEFGGFKKGFLSGTTLSTKKSTDSEITFIKQNPTKSSLIFEEVKEKHKPNAWITDDLLTTVSSDDKLQTWLNKPTTATILTEFQTDPRAAMVKYKDDLETQHMLSEFGKMLGSHFDQLTKNEPIKSDPNEIIISGYKPNHEAQIRSELDAKVADALSKPGVHAALLDLGVKNIIDALRTDPSHGQRLLNTADKETQAKIRLLIEAGVIGLQ